jgi:hypothetical protein
MVESSSTILYRILIGPGLHKLGLASLTIIVSPCLATVYLGEDVYEGKKIGS